MIRKIHIPIILSMIIWLGCDDANELLNQHIKDGPRVYAGKVDSLEIQSGYYRARVNLRPAEDVNLSHCILSWNVDGETKDSARVEYSEENYDEEKECYFTTISLPSIEGNLQIEAHNVDKFGNKSLLETGSAVIYGLDYVSSLVNAPIDISPQVDKVTFKERIGAVGNIISYERNDGTFTEEVYVTDESIPLIDAKRGGVVRVKTRYLINENDIDILEVADFTETEIPTNEGIDAMVELQETSPFLLDQQRLSVLQTFERISDEFNNPTFFGQYLNMDDDLASDMEYTHPLLYSYRKAFDKVIDEVANTQVENGSVAVWLLYNMGFVIKTPSVTFGIDINHRYAAQLEPYLDFLCVTHNHGDHVSTKLMDAMNANGKPVLSNFYTKDSEYMSKTPSTYQIGDISIRTDITDHLRDPNLPDFVTVFRIECGIDAGNFSLLHCGDSGFNPAHFTHVAGPLDLAVFRWGAARENDIIGTGSGQVQPEYIFLSHLIEQGHLPYPGGQASISQTLVHLPNVNCDNTVIPFWGEKMTWKNGMMF